MSFLVRLSFNYDALPAGYCGTRLTWELVRLENLFSVNSLETVTCFVIQNIAVREK